MISRATDIKNIDLKTKITGPIKLQRTPLAENDKCNLYRPKKGIIYMLSNNKDEHYIGLTTTKIEERIQSHKENPVNEKMAEFVAGEFTHKALFDGYSSEKQLQDLETYYIRKYEDQLNLLNINKKTKKDEHKFEIKEVKIETNKFPIEDSVSGKYFRIRYTVEGKRSEKKRRYNDFNKDMVYKEVLELRNELIKQYLL